jgi:hypothetical protein
MLTLGTIAMNQDSLQFLPVALPIMVTIVVTISVASWSQHKKFDELESSMNRGFDEIN